MKKILLLFAALLTLSVTASAQNPDGIPCFVDGDWAYALNPDVEHEVTVIMYFGKDGSNATELTIPSYVTYNGSRYLVTELGEGLFSWFNNKGNDVYTHSWEHENFANLEKVTIPNTVTKIGNSVFSGCSALTSITLPNSVTSIGAYAFDRCTALTSVTIPNSVTEIGISAFGSNPALTSVTISNSVTSIAERLFYGCTGLTSVTIPDSVTEIGNSAFYGCTGLTSVTIPDSVTEIGSNAFEGCTGLTSVTIPDSVTGIGDSAFSGCTSLTSVIIPNSVTSWFYGNPFSGCSSLLEIVLEADNTNYTAVDGVLYNSDRTKLIIYPAGKNGAFEIPNSVTEIGRYAFSGCIGLTSVTIPNSVTEIGKYAFSGCIVLTSVTIPNSVTEIRGDAFSGCTGLTSVTIPDSVTEIGSYAFDGCSGLTSVTIPDSVTEIGGYAFSGCTGLATIYSLPATPPACGNYVFWRVPETAVVYIPKGSFKAYFVETGWDHFTDFREMGVLDITLSESTITLNEGETATLTATITKDNDVTVESETWATSNPEVATVDNGVVTAIGEGSAIISYTVVDGYGVPHTESCDVTVSITTGVDTFTADDTTAEFYNLNGVRVNGDALTPGLYIKRQGSKATKVLVK